MFLKRFKISKIRFKISKKLTCSSLIIRHVTTFAVRAPLPLEQGLRPELRTTSGTYGYCQSATSTRTRIKTLNT